MLDTEQLIGNLPLLKLGRQQCRYPVREDIAATGRHLFCGQATLPERPYCEQHQGVVIAEDQRRGGSTFRRRRLQAA